MTHTAPFKGNHSTGSAKRGNGRLARWVTYLAFPALSAFAEPGVVLDAAEEPVVMTHLMGAVDALVDHRLGAADAKLALAIPMVRGLGTPRAYEAAQVLYETRVTMHDDSLSVIDRLDLALGGVAAGTTVVIADLVRLPRTKGNVGAALRHVRLARTLVLGVAMDLATDSMLRAERLLRGLAAETQIRTALSAVRYSLEAMTTDQLSLGDAIRYTVYYADRADTAIVRSRAFQLAATGFPR